MPLELPMLLQKVSVSAVKYRAFHELDSNCSYLVQLLFTESTKSLGWYICLSSERSIGLFETVPSIAL